MSLVLYNTITKKEEEFQPLSKDEVLMYTCGPTVYGRPHIGNFSSLLLGDLLRRWLEVSGYTVKHVINITDVGHLAGDDQADAQGEDKIEREAKKGVGDSELTPQDVLAVAEKYTQEYLADDKALNMLEPFARPKATETIPEMIQMIEVIIKKGHAYETEYGVYFAVQTFEHYGRLSGNTIDNLTAGARIDIDEQKRHPADFALWKKCVGVNAQHVLRWPSPWGDGFPGWHIECSCMSKKFLAERIDIHTGGEDNIFPHHECEIAQSECAGGSPFVGYWVHRRFIDMGDTKMSKSLGNVLNLDDIHSMGYSPADLRYLLLSVHYRTNLKFTEKGLSDAHKARRKIVEWMEEVQSEKCTVQNTEEIQKFVDAFTNAMNADLNTPAALAVVFDVMSWSRSQTTATDDAMSALKTFVATVQKTFGCFEPEGDSSLPEAVQTLLDERSAARVEKNFEESDRLRDAIRDAGYEVRDNGDEQVVKPL